MIKTLASLMLFEGYQEEEIAELLKNIRVRRQKYTKGSYIIFQNASYHSLFILIQGNCTGEMNSYEGKTVKIEQFVAPAIIAPGILFSENPQIPVSLVADSFVEILMIEKQDLFRLISCEQRLLRNFLRSVSDKIFLLSHKVELMCFKSIRSKLAHYLLVQSQGRTGFKMTHSIENLSCFFGVARQSLSRVLGEMEKEKLFSRKGKFFTLLNPSLLEKIEKE